MPQLDAEQSDALGEIFNIGVGRAASALSELLHEEVLLSVPHVQVLTVSEAAHRLSAADIPMYGVRQPFSGTLRGDALLIFPSHRSLDLVRLMAGQSVPTDELSAIEQDAMTEIGNVMLNACIASLGELLGSEFALGLPSVSMGDSRAILGTRIQNHLVVFLHIRFELKTSAIEGYVVFVLHTTSMETLRDALNRLLGRPEDSE